MAARISGGLGATSQSEHPVCRRRRGKLPAPLARATARMRRRFRTRTASTWRCSPSSAQSGSRSILLLFGFPLVLAVKLRHRPLVPIAAAVLVAYLARAGIDWDWEFPILTLVALGCAGVIVAEGVDRPSRTFRLGAHRAPRRVAGPRADRRGRDARESCAGSVGRGVRGPRLRSGGAEAKTAERLIPWSVEPLVLLGRAQAGCRRARARAGDFQARCFGRARALAGLARARGGERGRSTGGGTPARACPESARQPHSGPGGRSVVGRTEGFVPVQSRQGTLANAGVATRT